ncbi:MAG TPA: hypothetical protein VNG69_04515 [Casimicrobiaceae bacterium]|nr:hypothetical protein [Casimicrobiaceae bacterium]
MIEARPGEEIGIQPADDLEVLQRRASALKRKAEAATQVYDRSAWVRYAAIWVPIPFIVLLLRLHLEAWGYYVAGALFIAIAAVIYALDFAAVAKRDQAIEAAERAQRDYEEAREQSQREMIARAPPPIAAGG